MMSHVALTAQQSSRVRLLLTERGPRGSMTTFNNVTLNEKGLVCHTQRGADRFDTPFAQVSKLICYILPLVSG
jgi:hypothetical protein